MVAAPVIERYETYINGVDEYEKVAVTRGPICHVNGVRSYGASNSPVMFVGISPARDETTRTRRPLTGQSGLMLNACLNALEQKRESVYCTNLICTWMDDASDIPEHNIRECYPRLLNEIQTLKPKIIVLLGKLVTEKLMEYDFKKVRGAVQWFPEFNAYVMGTYHPSAILQSMGDYGASKDDKASKMIYDFIRDLKKIPDVCTWPREAPEAQIRYRVVNSSEQAQNVLDNLPRSEDFPISLDVETDYNKDDEEVEVFENKVTCVGIGSDNFAWVLTPRALFKKDGITPALNWPNLHWTMHNAIFDSGVMKRNLGVWINICEDTMLQSYSLDERSGIHRLKTLAREYLAAGFYEEDRFGKRNKVANLPPELLYEYNARDVIYTARLQKKFRQWQEEDNVRDFYKRLLIRPLNMYKETQYHGVNIDLKMRTALAILWGIKINEEEDEIQKIAQDNGWEGNLNISSSDQLAKFMFTYLGLPIIEYTRGGKPSTAKKVLDELKDQHEFVSKLVSLRRRYKMWGTYIVSLPEKLKVDSRAHPVVKLHGQLGGRPSYSDLAVQTFVAPTHPSEYNQMRKLIIAPPFEGYEGEDDYQCPEDEEYVIVEVDYGKAELWQAYSYSHDKQMLFDLLSGDYHTNVAMDIYQKQKNQLTKDERTWAKRTTFGILYDITEVGLAVVTNSTQLESKIRINRWYSRNVDYKVWHDNTQKTVRKTGELVSKTGRKRRIIILGNAHRAIKQAVNFPIQSTSSDVVLDSAVDMHPKLRRIGGHVLFTVHDSIVTKALKSRLKEHCQIMHDAMIAKRFDGVVRMPVEVKAGKTWGDVEGIHDCSESPTYEMNLENEYGFTLGGHCLYDYYRDELGQEI